MTTPFTLSTVSLRHLELPDALNTAQELGFTSVDLVGLRGLCEHVPVNGDARAMRLAARQFLASGLRAASVNADPGSYDGFDPQDAVDQRVRRLLDFAAETGTPLLVLPAGEKTATAHESPPLQRMADALNHAAERAWDCGVQLAVEAPYFGRPVDTLERAGTFFELLNPDIRMAFDVSHVEAAGDDVTGAWRRYSDRVGIVHLRDASRGDIRRAIGYGDIDFAGFLEAVDATDYTDDVVLELETRGAPFTDKSEEILAALAHLGAALRAGA